MPKRKITSLDSTVRREARRLKLFTELLENSRQGSLLDQDQERTNSYVATELRSTVEMLTEVARELEGKA